MPITRLHIFERFLVDYNLPKFKKEQYEEGTETPAINFRHSSDGMNFTDDVFDKDNRPPRKRNFFSRMVEKYKAYRQAKIDAAEEASKRLPDGIMDDAHVFMKSLSLSMTAEMKAKMEVFNAKIVGARAMGQQGLVERMEALRFRVVYELSMAGAGFQKYLTEEQVVKLINDCKKGLTVTWVRDFGRIIPMSVLETKIKADALKVFDNYVVLHFDPTKKDVTPPRDPILFGVLRNSTRLYFIADWTDEVCDFTLDKAEQFLIDNGNPQPIGHVGGVTLD